MPLLRQARQDHGLLGRGVLSFPFTDNITKNGTLRCSVFFLYFDNFCVIMNLSLSGGKALHTTAGGSAPLPKGGEAHANYFDIPYLRIGIYYQGKKREPPPWPVTVLSF